jgi:tetratricopeptide (TPR) repeat protein
LNAFDTIGYMNAFAKTLALSFAALAAAVASQAGQTAPCDRCAIMRAPFFTVSARDGGTATMSSSRLMSLHSSFVMPKPDGTVRFFTVGESAASINGTGNQSPLARFLDLAVSSRTEHINCGVGGYDSYDTASVVDEIAGYSPDVVTILVGNNNRNFLSVEPCDSWRKVLVRLYTLKERLRHPFSSVRAIEEGVSLALEERDLRRMVRRVRGSGAAAVLCTLPASMSGFPPDGALPLADKKFASAWRKMDGGDYARAKEFFNAYAVDHGDDPFALYCIGLCDEHSGNYDAAKGYYAKALQRDGAMDRCSPGRNDMIRRVAREEGAYLADLEQLFQGLSPHGITDATLLSDGVHWRSEYMGVFACGVVNALSQGRAPLPFRDDYPAVCPLDKLHGESEAAHSSYGYAAAYIKDWTLSKGQDDVYERALYMIDRFYRDEPDALAKSLNSPEEARGLLPQSIWFSPDGFESVWPHYVMHVGEFYRRIGRKDDAIECFTRALHADPQLYMARFYRALAYIDAGNKTAAQEDLWTIGKFAGKYPQIKVIAELEGFYLGGKN